MDLVTLYKGEDLSSQITETFDWATETIFDLIPDTKPILAGGALRSHFTNTIVRDYDLYFPSSERATRAYNLLLNRGWRQVSTPGAESIVLELTTISSRTGVETGMINLVSRKFFENPVDVIEHYDFTVCMCALNEDQISFHPDYWQDLVTRKLKLYNVENALNSLWRIQKYNKYGYTMDRSELWRIVEMIHGLPTLPNVDLTIEEVKGEKIPVTNIFTGS